MKKIFLIPLLTLVCSVMAWAADQHVSNIADLKSAIADASVETIYLDADIEYAESANSSCINILRSVTIDGQGHTLAGYGKRGTTSNYPTVAINQGGSSLVDVTLKNLQMINPMLRVVETRGNIHSVTIENCHIEALRQSGTYDQPITIGGNQSTQAAITIRNSTIKAPKYYPIVVFNPINLTLENSQIKGWNALYFKGVDSSAGSRGSVVTATNCNFDCPNPYDTPTNAFGMFVCEDDGISITLNNCGMHAEQLGNQTQTVFLLSNFASKTRRSQPMTFAITGDNSYINGKLVSYSGWAAGYYNNAPSDAAIPDPCPLSITISGGTYAFNPANQGWLKNQTYETEEELYDESNIGMVTIPSGFEVKEINTIQGKDTTILYRVRQEISGATALNDNSGQNPTEDIKVTTSVALANEETVAEYVEVAGGSSTDPKITVTVGEGKTFEVSNGMDVSGNAEVVAKPGATVVVGEGGLISEKPENIVIEANENGAASLLLDPAVVVNTTPNLIVKMTAKQIGRKDGDFYWHRFAMPVAGITSWEKEGSLDPSSTYPTYLYAWDYLINDWKKIKVLDMVPLQGYTLTLASNWINPDGTDAGSETEPSLNVLQDVTYTFKGNLIGNTNQPLNFTAEGFNYFGNSYTGYMDVLTLLNGIESNFVDGTVYMWCNDPTDEEGNYQSYVGVSVNALVRDAGKNRLAKWQKEVAPMQTFILRLRGADSADEEVDYASAIWGNPRYGNTSSASPAPRRKVAAINNEDSYLEIVVKGLNGKGSKVSFTENFANSDAFESGYDVTKYMNENRINLYATVAGENLSDVVSNKLEGKTLSLQTKEDMYYTMSFKNVEGEAYAIRDNVTGIVTEIQEGTTYEFTAQPNSTIEGRFEIVPVAKVATAIDNTEVKANVKGIYTIMGQYLGEDFNALPAGVYVVDGVKIVK